jgi:DNA uptake protein ComE-like DNA-binding protein
LTAIKNCMYVENTYSPRKIMINFAEWKEFVHHPYIDKSLANAIIATRDKSGPFHSVGDLRKIKFMNDSTISKISPYITF